MFGNFVLKQDSYIFYWILSAKLISFGARIQKIYEQSNRQRSVNVIEMLITFAYSIQKQIDVFAYFLTFYAWFVINARTKQKSQCFSRKQANYCGRIIYAESKIGFITVTSFSQDRSVTWGWWRILRNFQRIEHYLIEKFCHFLVKISAVDQFICFQIWSFSACNQFPRNSTILMLDRWINEI